MVCCGRCVSCSVCVRGFASGLLLRHAMHRTCTVGDGYPGLLVDGGCAHYKCAASLLFDYLSSTSSWCALHWCS
jgi:hypothetical protein